MAYLPVNSAVSNQSKTICQELNKACQRLSAHENTILALLAEVEQKWNEARQEAADLQMQIGDAA